ncbi:Uncharacterized protein FWK35_00027776, partial [Aphis craccivora]
MIHAEIVNEAGKDSSTNTMSETSHQKEDKMVQNNIKTFNKKLYQNKIKIIQRLKRRNSKMKSLKVTQMLEDNFGGFPLTLLLHEHKSKMLHKKGVRYTNAMKDFAKTLFFYSSKDYKYVRKIFTLPHPSTIRKWLSSTECEPGFFEEVFLFFKQEVSKNCWLQDCSLVHDSMSLRKQLVWEPDKGRYAGNVDVGTGENSELATEALVLMIVSLTRQFKCPIGFFYVNKINSSVLSTLISTAIIKLNEVGIQVWNVTCDGAPSNLQSFKKLGCNFYMHSLNTKFTVNNANRSIEVYSIFDTCHMLKLARSSLAGKQIIQSNIGDIKWQYISSLNAFQNELGLKFANKLSSQHINYKNSIMKVKLAAQTLSSGVADEIEYLQQKGEPSFQNSDATICFIRQIDRIFDILNSRIPFSKGYKSPINPARGGNNNNPNYVQFKKTLRQLLYTKNIIVVNGNCSYYEIPGGDILDFRSEKRSIKKSTNNDDVFDELDVFGDEYKNLLYNIYLKEYTGEILDCIGGYIVRNISRKIVCPFCIDILIDGSSDHSFTKNINFTSFITRGKLKIVSPAVSLILKELEKSFQLIVVMQKKLHGNVKTNILMLARKNILTLQCIALPTDNN